MSFEESAPDIRIDDEYRVDEYRKDESIETSLKRINDALAPLEEEIISSYGEALPHPFIFIIGMARSGSTLLAQMLASTGYFWYPSNFLARFWKAPVLAATLEKSLQLNKQDTIQFQSEFGVTKGLTGPHEFGYFWERWFTFRTTHSCDYSDWLKAAHQTLRKEISALMAIHEKPIFFKSLVCGMNIPLLLEVFPDAYFFVCKRQNIYIAQSVLQSRRKRHGSESNWFSIRPANYEQIKNLAIEDQIAAQIDEVYRTIMRDLTDYQRKITINYEDLCLEPKNIVGKLIETVHSGADNPEWNSDNLPPAQPPNNTKRISDREFSALREALNKRGILDE